MSRRNGGGVAVSTATESQRKGSTPPGIHFAMYNKRPLLTTQLGEYTIDTELMPAYPERGPFGVDYG